MFGKIPPSWIQKKLASSNFAPDNTWAMPANKNSLDMHAIFPFLAKYVTPPTPTHGPKYFLIAKSYTFMD